MVAVVDPEKCDGCGTCVDECSTGAITIENDVAVVNEEECVDCEVCVDACPNEAITMQE
ncbi:MAG: 4Fe-4S binding protein [Candidatus Syntropharchaeia archaeon]